MEKMRVGVVGIGYLGKYHAEKYARMPDVDLVGLADPDPARSGPVAAALGTVALADYRQLLGRVDAVSIVVPTPLHFPVALDFLSHDVDVLIEKPMATTCEEADELIALAERRGRLIQVGHLERFNPAVVALKGVVGEPLFIEAHRLSVYQPRGTDVSVVLDLMIHDIDIILNLVRSDLRGIHAAGIPVVSPHLDIANARLEFASGCVANVTASRIAMKSERKIRIFQRNAYLSVDFANREITVVRRGDGDPASVIPGMETDRRCFTQGDALDDELKSFVKAVRERIEPEVTGPMGRDALRIALDIMDQIRRNNRQRGDG